ncbi:MAG TPA: ParB N-terminal domain-containing protein [Microlunatus sp.]
MASATPGMVGVGLTSLLAPPRGNWPDLLVGGLRPRSDRSSIWVPLRRVRPDRRFPLRAAVGADLGVLVASIRVRGVVQPIVVEPDGDGYVIREGHRRVAAAVLAGLQVIPAFVQDRPLSPQAWLLQQAAESASVRVLGSADRRRLVLRLRGLGCSWRRIAAAFGVTPRTVAWWVCDDDEDHERLTVGPPRQRATRRLIAAHADEFDRLLAEERQTHSRRVAA